MGWFRSDDLREWPVDDYHAMQYLRAEALGAIRRAAAVARACDYWAEYEAKGALGIKSPAYFSNFFAANQIRKAIRAAIGSETD
jgi:hypothetical protein